MDIYNVVATTKSGTLVAHWSANEMTLADLVGTHWTIQDSTLADLINTKEVS